MSAVANQNTVTTVTTLVITVSATVPAKRHTCGIRHRDWRRGGSIVWTCGGGKAGGSATCHATRSAESVRKREATSWHVVHVDKCVSTTLERGPSSSPSR